MDLFLAALGPSLDSDDDCRQWTPLMSPTLESQPFYSPLFYGCSDDYDASVGGASWVPFSMQVSEQESLSDNVESCSTVLPAETVYQRQSLETISPGTTVPLSMGFDMVDNWQLRASNEKSGNNRGYDSASTSETTSRKMPYRPAWGAYSERSKKGAASSMSYKKRADSWGEGSNDKKHFGMDSSARQLRTSKRSSLSKATSGSDSDTYMGPLSSIGNDNHNLTEKRYRSRLNDKFETLLSALPRSLLADADGGHIGSEHAEKKICKAEVLVLAKEHIRALEREAEELEWENQALANDVEKLGKAMRVSELRLQT